MIAIVLPFIAGAMFAIGLAVSGMTQPAKVVGFLDFAGDWDPSLAFVMIGAIGAYFPLYRWILRRSLPVFGAQYFLPTRTDLDAKLLTGAALFGIGWGIAGFCPGPALASIGTTSSTVLLFVGAMLCGMFLHHMVTITLARGSKPTSDFTSQATS